MSDESVIEHFRERNAESLDEARKALLHAADYLQACGWQQGYLGHMGGPACLLGAICNVTGSNDLQTRAVALLGIGGISAVIDWNDAPERTKEEVVAKLRSVALGG